VPTPPAPPATLDTFRAETTVAPVRRRPPPAAERSPPSAEDAALLGRLRSTAEEARARAVAAGVAESILARGDSSLARAEVLAGRRRTAEAAVELSAASTLWSDAAARPRVSAAPVPAPAETVQRPAPPPPPAPAPAPAPQPDPSEQIHRLFAEYGDAIEARSVDAIRRVYPGLSPAQSREWEEFFRGVHDVDVELDVTALNVTGDSAAAQLAGVYVFEDPGTRRTKRESVAFQAQLRRMGGRWRIASLR